MFKLCCLLGLFIFIMPAFPKAVLEADAASYDGFLSAHQLTSDYEQASERLSLAIKNPEYMLKNWVDLPLAPNTQRKKPLQLTLREAILLALRYNPDIQNAELERIIQRYQLRQAYNEFELQYALAGSANFERNRFSDVGSSTGQSYMASPEATLKTKWGTRVALTMDNNVATYDSYNPVLRFSVTQPLLRGFGSKVNEVGLKNSIDNEHFNQLRLKQAVINQMTSVINAYRALVLSARNLEIQRLQLKEAKNIFVINKKKIAAGQLEPTANIQQSYQIESLSLMEEQAVNTLQNDVQNLLQAVGLDPSMPLAVPSDIQLKALVVPDMKRSIALALKNNVDYLAVKQTLVMDKRAYDVAKNEQLWDLSLSASVQTGDIANVDGVGGLRGIYEGRNINESARLTLKIPIRDLSQRSKLINAKVTLEKDRIHLMAAKRAIITEVRNLIHAIESQAKRYQLALKQVQMAERSFELQKKRQEAGIASTLDVTNTQNQLIQAQSGLISAKIAYLNQLSSLQRLLGTSLDVWQIKLRGYQ